MRSRVQAWTVWLALAAILGAQQAPPPAGAPPAAAPPAATAPQPAQPGATVTPTPSGRAFLQVDNASLTDVIDVLARQLRINYILDPRVKGAVTVKTYGELRGPQGAAGHDP
jgi:general secretion pathway protein D